jgi:heme-degrading monooxygenase HmoA
MHMQVINFRLQDLDAAGYEAMCDQLAPAFAAIPGLVSKVWLADPATSTYGGVYTWESRTAYEAFTQSDLFNAVRTHPNLKNLTSRDFGVIEAPTRVTRGLLAVTA